MQQIYRRTPLPKCYLNKVALFKSHFGIGVSCKFAAYFQSTFSQEYLWLAASVAYKSLNSTDFSKYLSKKTDFIVDNED